MAFALRRQQSDSSRKRNGGVNIRRKNRRYLAAGLTVFSLLFGGLQVWAAEEPDAGWETKIQKEEKSNMEILIASEQPYTYLSQMKERIQFVGGTFSGRALSAAGNFTLSDDQRTHWKRRGCVGYQNVSGSG